MTRALVGEMKTFITAYDNEKYNNNDLSGLFSIYLDLNVEFKNDQLFDKPIKERWFSPIDRTLRRELKSNIGNGNYWFDTTSYKELIHINIRNNKGYFDGTIYDEPVEGTREALEKISNKYTIIVHTAKARHDRGFVDGKSGKQLIWEWLENNDLDQFISKVTAEKPRAVAYIDDKSIKFSSWEDALEQVDNLD